MEESPLFDVRPGHVAIFDQLFEDDGDVVTKILVGVRCVEEPGRWRVCDSLDLLVFEEV